jgi:protein-tyrosine phosphatase
MSRSPTVIIAYLMKELGLPFWQAFWIVQEQYKGIAPNKGILHLVDIFHNQV